MRKLFLIPVFILLYNSVFSLAAELGNNNCERELFFCEENQVTFDYGGAGACTVILWYKFQVGPSGIPGIQMCSPDGITAYALWGPFNAFGNNSCMVINSNPPLSDTVLVNANCHNTNTDFGTLPEGFYYLAIRPTSCVSSVTLTPTEGELVCENDIPCENCIGSFAPQEGVQYLISAWVKDEGATSTTTTYTNAQLEILFPGNPVIGPFLPTGQIIDGWQRIEGTFTVPAGATQIEIKAVVTSGTALFDDIRVMPFNGSMKTYVYDPVNMRLLAELDERNYATFYEYDEEGKLLRIKKETERGIMTIQESKTSMKKQ